ncbi:MAG: methylenetetrahydrofolate--tRNA-(uracil(54)-C(5))-methyltransferase (FADH(2)-oxidizing) TrmFO [Clostridia bacterium]|nr:methylenetetrahydrofolate--tRNA-(uracil(54)-C(5))-methyltransferase (FADH(2)-oxidizing) TrmFO [Clostridia bacterium]MBP3583190.1 methylenetetrahydrofolate--tRNA-(uracil(54)-C(5))-methyltransferase (FADH(2)-oxidizing) TrmFO [Clostridia bacterium]
MDKKITVIGAGLAGCEAAWQAAERGVEVTLYEMKPKRFSPAHHSEGFAELVCSNSLRSIQLSNAVGLLKEELSLLGSLIMEAAYQSRVPAGAALAVNREAFSNYITEKIRNHPKITVINEEITEIPTEGIVVVASGPLTSEALSKSISELTGGDELHFFDAAAPIVDFSSINTEVAFFASRYGKGDAEDYLNCPMTKEQYDAFYEALISAECAPLKAFDRELQEDLKVFEGCMPVEVMAKRGYDTLRFGPMKPVGLPLPATGEDAYATVQLRRENREGTMYNLVGFQTHLTFPEQRRVFGMIPGLENAEFFRYGVMHRNTYLNSPGFLTPTYSVKGREGLFFAGQMTGVEGYIESTSSGFVAGLNAALLALGEPSAVFPKETQIGALAHYVSEGGIGSSFQPMNANFGIIAPLDKKVKGGKKYRNEAYAERSLAIIKERYGNSHTNENTD